MLYHVALPFWVTYNFNYKWMFGTKVIPTQHL